MEPMLFGCSHSRDRLLKDHCADTVVAFRNWFNMIQSCWADVTCDMYPKLLCFWGPFILKSGWQSHCWSSSASSSKLYKPRTMGYNTSRMCIPILQVFFSARWGSLELKKGATPPSPRLLLVKLVVTVGTWPELPAQSGHAIPGSRSG